MMPFDYMFVRAQADYKRVQLTKSYPKSKRRTFVEESDSVLDGNPWWPELWARLSLLVR